MLLVAPSVAEKLPESQDLQLSTELAPVEADHVPNGHKLQVSLLYKHCQKIKITNLIAPTVDEYVPLPHGKQLAALVAPITLE